LIVNASRSWLVVLLAFVLSSCYSFTGSSIPPHIHSIGIPLVDDNSGFGQPDVRQKLTDLLIQKFTSDGSLRVADRSVADAVLELSIPPNGIYETDVSVRAGEIVTTKRVNIRVQATYRDQKKQKIFWTRDFSQSADYPLQQSLAGLRDALSRAEDKLGEDLLLAVISNW
jgi:hypothetical protein